MELKNKNIVVVGLGASGVATAKFLAKRGARVIGADTAAAPELGDRVRGLQQIGVTLELGPHRPDVFEIADLVVISPGVPHTLAAFERARSRGVPVIGEVELAFRFIEEPIIAITGTNGKTTTTTLVGEMLRQSGIDTFVGGNIGPPLIGYADQGQKSRVVVAEISSFQLDTIETFRPRVGVLLNIADDHLDRYADLAAYAKSKARLFLNQSPDDVAIINGTSAMVAELTGDIRSRILTFYSGNSPRPFEEGALIEADRIVLQLPALDKPIIARPAQADTAGNRWVFECSEINLPGVHNLENAAAAALAAMTAGATPEGIRKTLKTFKGLPHRLETLGNHSGVRFVNDSKATNVDAVIRALEGYAEPVILIMGGRNKGGDFKLLTDIVRIKVKAIIAIGESRQEIATVLGGAAPVSLAENMAAAVSAAAAAAQPGDTVLLSPACASFDMYENYAQRGQDFRRAFMRLGGKDMEKAG